MRLIEKRKLITDTDSFSKFKNNIQLDPSYTVVEEALDYSFQFIPQEFRNADLTMVAGAYKVGQIATFDRYGAVVDLGFSRSTLGYGVVGNGLTSYSVNNPVLDSGLYKPAFGYLLDSSLINPNTGTELPPFVESVAGFSGTLTGALYDNINPLSLANTAPNGFVQLVSSTGVNITSSRRFASVLIKVSSANVGNSYYIQTSSAFGHRLYFDKFGNYVSSTNIQDYSITKLNNEYLYIQTLSALTTEPDVRIRIYNSSVTGDIIDILAARNIPVLPSVTTMNSVPKKIIPLDSTYSSDIIAPILLTNNARIYIKTASKVQEVELSAGSNFNVNDYVINDKLICFAIKYRDSHTNSSIVDKFIDNLNADGTYEVYPEILEKTARYIPFHLRENADLTMIPGAYRLGSIAAFDINGDIVNLGFSRYSEGYAFNSTFKKEPANMPRLDTYYYKKDALGYLVELIADTSGFYKTLCNVAQQGTITDNGVGLNTFIANSSTVLHSVSYEAPIQFTVGNRLEVLVFKSSTHKYVDINLSASLNQYVIIDINNGNVINQNLTFFNVKVEPFSDFYVVTFFNTAAMPVNNTVQVFYIASNGVDVIVPGTGGTIDFGYLRDISKGSYIEDSNASTVTIRQPDIIAPINISHDSTVFIKTTNSVKEFTMLQGTVLNISDHVINNKLLCLVIKRL